MKTIPVDPVTFRAVRAEISGPLVSLSPVPRGSGRPRGAGTREGWIEGLAMTRLALDDHHNRLGFFPATSSAIGGLMTARGADRLHQVMVNRLDAGGFLDVHRDGRPFEPPPERWHLPIITSADVTYWDEDSGEPFTMTAGKWWGPVPYWLLHSMRNAGDRPRLHLVVDLIREEE